jgi:hypothetical protein
MIKTQSREPTAEEVFLVVANYAAERIKAGYANQAVVDDLVFKGVDRKSADKLVREITLARYNARRQATDRGQSNMTKGALWFIGGSAITLITMSYGDGFVLAYGAIIGGAVQFLAGWWQSRM